MRIHFKNIGQADHYLKVCKRQLISHLVKAGNTRAPSQKIRNAFSQGFGYSSYQELSNILSGHGENNGQSPSKDDLTVALAKGFTLALAIASEYGLSPADPTNTSPEQLANATVEELKKEAVETTHEEHPHKKAERLRRQLHVELFKMMVVGDLRTALKLARADSISLYDFDDEKLRDDLKSEPGLITQAAAAVDPLSGPDADFCRAIIREFLEQRMEALSLYRNVAKAALAAGDNLLYETSCAFAFRIMEYEAGVPLIDQYRQLDEALTQMPDSTVIQMALSRYCRLQLFEYEDAVGEWLDIMVRKHPNVAVVQEERGNHHLWTHDWLKATKRYLTVLQLLAKQTPAGSSYYADVKRPYPLNEVITPEPRWSKKELARLTRREFRARALFAAYDLDRMDNNPIPRMLFASVLNETRIEGTIAFVDMSPDQIDPPVYAITTSTPEERRDTCAQIHRKYGLNPDAIYKNSPRSKDIFAVHRYEPGALSGRGLVVKKLTPGHLLAVSVADRWTHFDSYLEDDGPRDPEKALRQVILANGPQHYEPYEYVLDLRGEIISTAREEVVGFMTGRVYLFSAMIERFSPDYIRDYFDGDNAEEPALVDEIRKSHSLKHLLKGDGGVAIYLKRFRIQQDSRGSELGPKALDKFLNYACRYAACELVIVKPYPLPQTPADGGFKYLHDNGTREHEAEFRTGVKKLTAYYKRVGMEPPRPRSEYLFKKLNTADDSVSNL